MYDIMCNIMVKATSRSVHHAFSKYLDLAHEGQQIVITKRGKPWAKLEPIKNEKPGKLDWEKVFQRTRENFKGRKVEAVKTLLKMRDEERW
jgi:antitoxin (DNA-binding transcriptional repressor) of toxin-antitoxin stability system